MKDQNQIITGTLGKGVKIRYFKLKDFKEEFACGYVKLEKSNNCLMVKVIDTYNLESLEDEQNYLELGFVKIGYPTKNQ